MAVSTITTLHLAARLATRREGPNLDRTEISLINQLIKDISIVPEKCFPASMALSPETDLVGTFKLDARERRKEAQGDDDH